MKSLNSFSKKFLIIFFGLTTYPALCESIFNPIDNYIYNPLNMKLNFIQKEKSIFIEKPNDFGVLEIPIDYYLIFETNIENNKNVDFVMRNNQTQKYFYSTSSKELYEKQIYDEKINESFEKKNKLISLNQNEQSSNLKFISDRLKIFESENYFEVQNIINDKEKFYCYKFFFKNLTIENDKIKQLYFTPISNISKILIKFSIGPSNYQTLLFPNSKNEFLFDVGNHLKKYKRKKIKIQSLKFFSDNKIDLINASDLLSYYGRDNEKYNVDVLFKSHKKFYFAVPISFENFRDKMNFETTDYIKIKNIYISSLSKIKVLDRNFKYLINKKNRFFLNKILNLNFNTLNKKESINLQKTMFKFKKNKTYHMELEYASTYDYDSNFDLEFISIEKKGKIFEEIIPNTILSLNFEEDFTLKGINLINLNNLDINNFRKLKIYEEKTYSSITNNVSTFEFPLLISPDPKNFILEKIKLEQNFRKIYEKNKQDIVYQLAITENNKVIDLDLNKFFINLRDHFDVLFLKIENSSNNLNELLKKHKPNCPIKLIINRYEKIECIFNSTSQINFSKYENVKINSLKLEINNNYKLFDNYINLSGINIFIKNLDLKKNKFINLLSEAFDKNENDARMFLLEYVHIHPVPINVGNLLDF